MGREVKRAREVAESSKRRAGMKKERAKAKRGAEQRPDWLPEGWTVDVRVGASGRKVKCYTSPGSGRTFYSKPEVLRSLEATDDGISARSFSEHNKSIVVAQPVNSPEWLPHGWVLEIKTRLHGGRAGKKYKCYFDPFSGSRFYSKAEVLRFLNSGNHYTPTSGEKKRLKASSTDNVLAQIEYSPVGLPSGWIKETIYRKPKGSSKAIGTRRDPYYIDPASGYVFRSLKDAVLYVKTGKLSKYAFRPRKRSLVEMYSLEKESPPPISVKELKSLGCTTRRRLFTKDTSTSNGETLMQIGESPDKLLLPPPDHGLSENFQKACPIVSPDTEHVEGSAGKKRRKVLEAATGSLMNAPKHGEKNAKRGKPTMTVHNLPVESGGRVIECDGLPDKLHLPPYGLASCAGNPKTDGTSFPDIEHTEGKADNKRNRGLETATGDGSLYTGRNGEQGTKTSRPNRRRSRSEMESKEREELLEPSVVLEKSSEPTNEMTPVSQERKKQRRKDKLLTLPTRSSKRLAGLKAASATDVVIHHQSCQPMTDDVCNGIEEPARTAPSSEPETMDTAREAYQTLSNGVCNHIQESAPLPDFDGLDAAEETCRSLSNGIHNVAKESTPLAHPQRTDVAGGISGPLSTIMCNGAEESVPLTAPEKMAVDETDSLGGQMLLTGQASEAGASSPFALPFSDAWSDPCIEFAVKTLMGEIPVLDEGLAIEEYVQKQLSSVEASNRSASVSAMAYHQGVDTGKLLGPAELLDKQHLPLNDEGKLFPSTEGKPLPVEKGRPPRAEASKVRA